jgi:hypothetical protein
MGIKTTKLKNGTRIVRSTTTVPEWRLQSEQCRRLRALPAYGRSFLLVGGMEAGKRGPQTATVAKATGLTAGHPDLTIFLPGGRCAFIENKTEAAAKKKKRSNGLDPAQVDRHEALRRLGHTVEVIVAANESEAADKAVGLVMGWLAANDNGEGK